MKKIYVASPLGFSETGRFFMYEMLIPMLDDLNFECIDPWKLTPAEFIKKVDLISDPVLKREEWKRLNKIIAGNNVKGIVECDGMIAVLDGPDVDSGTASETGYAAALNKKIFGYRNDFRQSGDNEGAIVNLQVEYFILNSGGRIVSTLAELKTELSFLFSV